MARDFTSYLREQAGLIAWLGIIGMSVALWTTGDANLYLPVIQTSSIMRRPRRVMTVICGLLGTLLGLGIYQQFLFWIGALAIWVPPLIGPVIAHYYFVARGKMDAGENAPLPVVNWAALPLTAGLLSYYTRPNGVPAISGLQAQMVAYLLLQTTWRAAARSQGKPDPGEPGIGRAYPARKRPQLLPRLPVPGGSPRAGSTLSRAPSSPKDACGRPADPPPCPGSQAGACSTRRNEKDTCQGCGPRAFMALKWAVASSADCPPDRKAMPGTAAGTSLQDPEGAPPPPPRPACASTRC